MIGEGRAGPNADHVKLAETLGKGKPMLDGWVFALAAAGGASGGCFKRAGCGSHGFAGSRDSRQVL